MNRIIFISLIILFSNSLFGQTQNDLNLIKAAYDGNEATVTSLLTKGANVNATDAEGYTAIIYASAYGYVEIMKKLIAKGADVSKLRNDVNPVFAAVNNNNTVALDLLIAAGADINCIDINGYTPLMFAAQEGYIESVEYLISKGAKIDAENNDGHTALSIATQNNFNDIVDFILQNNPKKAGYTKPATTPLNTADYVENSIAKDKLTKYGMKENSTPGLEYLSGGVAFFVTPFDIMSGAQAGVHEGMFKIDLIGGYVTESTYSGFSMFTNTKYNKTKELYYGAVYKRIDVYRKAKVSVGVSFGADGMLASGESQIGTTVNKILYGASIGGFYKSGLGLFRLNYTYLIPESGFYKSRISFAVGVKLYKFKNSTENFIFADKTLYML